MEEKRQYPRHQTFWTVSVVEEPSNKEIVIGYLLNISMKGVNLWVDKEDFIPEVMEVIVYPPQNLPISSLRVTIRRLWTKTESNNPFIEVGCEFSNLNEAQLKLLQELTSPDMIKQLISPQKLTETHFSDGK